MKGKFYCIILFIFFCFTGGAQIFEAENAILSGGAKKVSSSLASGGYYVAQGEGNLTFDIDIESESSFNIYIKVASPNGIKSNILRVDGSSINFNTNHNSYINLKVASFVKLKKGAHKVEIIKSWGWINIDYIELEKADHETRFNINTKLVTPNPSDEAVRLYCFLYDNYNQKIISGTSTIEEAEWVKNKTGKSPALVGLDYLFVGRQYTWYNENEPFNQGKAWAENNGILTFSWHWRDPSRKTEEFYSNKTSFDILNVFDESSDDYKAMLDDIDLISTELNRFQELGIPIIWRPLHEAAGGWFWWGAKGPEACKKLWQIMFDRMVNVNGIRNLIWVWTHEPGDNEWFPGDEYVDIVGRDIYLDGDHGSQMLEFNEMTSLYGGQKMVAISECGSFPDVDNLIADEAGWLWFMPWNGKFTREPYYNSIEIWQKNMHNDYVITLDEMPDLKTYTSPLDETGTNMNVYKDELKVYPTFFNSQFNIYTNRTNLPISIYNELGMRIRYFFTDTFTTVVSTSKWPSGMYFVKAEGQTAAKVFKK